MIYEEMKKYYDEIFERDCYDYSCEARDCLECYVFLEEIEYYESEKVHDSGGNNND